MYTAITVLIVLVCVLLVLVVLVQNPKGGGIASGIIGANQLMGVKKTSDFIEKLTWGLAIALIALCFAATMVTPKAEDRQAGGTAVQEQLDNAGTAPANQPAAPANQPAAPAPAGK